jgi:hypothetical protein
VRSVTSTGPSAISGSAAVATARRCPARILAPIPIRATETMKLLRGPIRLLASAMLICLVVAGCGMIKHTPAGQSDEPLEAKLSELKDSGASAPLSDLTDFSWDEVHLSTKRRRATRSRPSWETQSSRATTPAPA